MVKKEHIGQILTYMYYLDKCIKSIYKDKNIEIIICRNIYFIIIIYNSNCELYKSL